ncbi:MAG: TULIP family P47-like protein [Nitrospirota bacterium]|nr:TULIP family P47-like protein [Nitrospirota bacterium]
MANNIVDTMGWDTVTAITYKDVNDSIVQQGSSPTSFTQVAPDNSASVSGSFGQWALSTGGSGADIMMMLPVTSGTVTVQGTDYPIASATATVLVRANFLPQPNAPNSQALVLQTAPTASVTLPASVESLQPAQSNFLADAALRQLLQDWLNNNLQDFNHTFAVVDFNAEFSVEGLNWLRPSHTGYAVAEPSTGATLDNSVFAVMCLIDGNTNVAGLEFQVSPFAIPADKKAGFVISSEKFLKHMMLDAMPMMFDGIPNEKSSEYFKIDNDGTRITNIQPVTLRDTKLDNGKIVNPTIDARKYSIAVNETELQIGMTDATFEYSPGITVHLNYEGASTLSFDATNDILDLMVVSQSGSGSVEVGQGLRIAEIVISVVALVLSVVGGIGAGVGKAASKAVQEAAQAAAEAAEAAGESTSAIGTVTAEGAESAQAMNQATVTALRGLVAGTPAEVSQFAATCFSVAKFAGLGAAAFGIPSAIMPIVEAAARGDYQSMLKVTNLTDDALGKATMWPAGVPGYTLVSAELNGALQFGLDHRV